MSYPPRYDVRRPDRAGEGGRSGTTKGTREFRDHEKATVRPRDHPRRELVTFGFAKGGLKPRIPGLATPTTHAKL